MCDTTRCQVGCASFFGDDSVFVTGVPVLRLRRQTPGGSATGMIPTGMIYPLPRKSRGLRRMSFDYAQDEDGEKRVEAGVVPGGTEPVKQFPEKK